MKQEESMKKNTFDIVERYLQNPENVKSIWDNEAIVWVDWREYDEDIIDYFNEKIKIDVDLIDNNKDYGDDIILKKGKKTLQIPYTDIMERDITITYLNEFIKPDYEIRWFMESLGSDTLGFVSLTKDKWRILENEFGEIYLCHYFEPITIGKRMFGLDIDEISAYSKLRNNNKNILYAILYELLALIVNESKLNNERQIGNIDLKTYDIKKKQISNEMEKIIKTHNIIV